MSELAYECLDYDGKPCPPTDRRCVAKLAMGEDCVPVHHLLILGGKPFDHRVTTDTKAGQWRIVRPNVFQAYAKFLKGEGHNHYAQATTLYRGG